MTLSLDSLARLRHDQVVAFVRSRGWEQGATRNDLAHFFKPGVDRANIVLPQAREFADYEARLRDALEIVAMIENLEEPSLVTSLLLPESSDILKWRRDDDKVTAGTLPLDDGIMFLDGARRAFLASANSAIDPRRYHARLHTRNANEFLDHCRLGQTEEGSYVVTIYCPITIPEAAGKHKGQLQMEPFGRRVSETLMKQISQLVVAAEKNEPDLLEVKDPQPSVISGNLCEAVLQMAAGPMTELSVAATWLGKAPNVPSVARIQEQHISAIESFAKILRPEPEMTEETFIGKIGSLTASPDIESREGGDVTIHTQTSDGPVRAKVHLERPSDYVLAIEAHEKSLNVGLRGRLERRRGGSVILDPRDFRVVE